MEIKFTSKDIFTIYEAAALLSVHRTTIYRWFKSGELRYIELGGKTFVPRTEVERIKKGTERGIQNEGANRGGKN